MTALSARVLEQVQGLEPVFTALLKDLVESESPSAHPAAHERVRHTLAAAFDNVGFLVREVAPAGGPRHLYARPRARHRSRPLQLVVGHFDTVWPVGTLAERPFAVADNIVSGPGAFDMKGGLAMLVVALGALEQLGLKPVLEPVVFINADEEIGSRSSTRYIERLARRAARAFVLEPALGETGALKTRRKGIGRFTITVHGKAAHAGLDPDAGASAILELSHVIQKLFAMNDPGRGITVNVGTVDGGIQPNVIAPHSTAVVDVRVPSVADGKAIERQIHGLEPETPGVRLRVEGGIGRPALEATPQNRRVWELAQRTGQSIGLELEEAEAGGGSDGNTTSRYTATLDGLGPVGHGAHAPHEFLYIDRTLERAALLAMLLLAPIEQEEAAP